MKSLAKNSLYNVAYQTISLTFPLITSIYISRILLEDGIGRVAYAQNVASYFLTVAVLGFPAYGIREIAKVKNSKTEKNKAFTEMFLINAVSTMIATAAYLVLIFRANAFRCDLPLYLSAGLQVFLNLFGIDWLYQGEEEYAYITKRNLFIKIVSIIAMLFLVRSREDYVLYALISSLGVAGNNLFNVAHAHKYVHFDFKDIHISKHLKPLFLLTMAGFFGNIYNKIDITMLGIMASEATVGFYSNAHKIILILVSCCQAISAVFLPRLSYYYKNDREQLNALVSKGTDILLLICIPAMVGVAFVAKDIIVLLYGETFAPAGVTLMYFAPLIIIRPLGDLLCYQLLICSGHEGKRIPAYIVASILNVILNACLIPRLSENGAAIASVITELFVNTVQLYYTVKIVHLKMSKTHLQKVLVATIIMVGVIVLLDNIELAAPAFTAFAILGGAAAYFAVLCLLKDEYIRIMEDFAKSMVKRNK